MGVSKTALIIIFKYSLAEQLQRGSFCQTGFMQPSAANFANLQNWSFMKSGGKYPLKLMWANRRPLVAAVLLVTFLQAGKPLLHELTSVSDIVTPVCCW